MGKIFVLNHKGIERLLSTAIVGRIAYGSAQINDGRPGIVPLAYGYDGVSIYAVGPMGHKIHVMRAQPLVTFEVDDVTAEDRWQSVVVEATYEELTDEAERAAGLQVIFRDQPVPHGFPDQIVYRLRITARSGRFEVPDEEAHLYESPADPADFGR